jgi:hypothetical protein
MNTEKVALQGTKRDRNASNGSKFPNPSGRNIYRHFYNQNSAVYPNSLFIYLM